MSEDKTPDAEEQLDEPIESAPDSRAMRSLLQRSLPQAPPIREGEIVEQVQRTLRVRSRGKFYGEGWNASHARYLLFAVTVVLLVALAYFAMAPGALFGT